MRSVRACQKAGSTSDWKGANWTIGMRTLAAAATRAGYASGWASDRRVQAPCQCELSASTTATTRHNRVPFHTGHTVYCLQNRPRSRSLRCFPSLDAYDLEAPAGSPQHAPRTRAPSRALRVFLSPPETPAVRLAAWDTAIPLRATCKAAQCLPRPSADYVNQEQPVRPHAPGRIPPRRTTTGWSKSVPSRSPSVPFLYSPVSQTLFHTRNMKQNGTSRFRVLACPNRQVPLRHPQRVPIAGTHACQAELRTPAVPFNPLSSHPAPAPAPAPCIGHPHSAARARPFD